MRGRRAAVDATGGRGRRDRPSLVARARRLIEREDLLGPRSRVLIMVSGGQDSVVLLELLATPALGGLQPQSSRVLHINHHLRGPDSEADEALVREHCRRLGVALTVVHRPLSKEGGNVQERARDARRTTALEVARANGCDRIAIGHTVDDQAENLLYRMGRYGGLAALRGMLPRDLPWVRPLLEVRRSETARFCAERGLDYAVDRGNAYPGYARTGIREQVLPAWEAALPGAVGGAARTAEVAAEAELLLREVVAVAGIDIECGHQEVARLHALPAAVRRAALHAWLDNQDDLTVSRAAVLAVEGLLQVEGSASRALPGGWRAYREYDRLWVSRSVPSAGLAPAAVPLTVPGEVTWGGVIVGARPVDHFFAPDPAREAYVDERCLYGSLVVRAPLPGDRVRPLGGAGYRKVQDVLVDLRIPARARASVPLVAADAGIVWMCGLLVSEGGRIAPDTQGIVRLSLDDAKR